MILKKNVVGYFVSKAGRYGFSFRLLSLFGEKINTRPDASEKISADFNGFPVWLATKLDVFIEKNYESISLTNLSEWPNFVNDKSKGKGRYDNGLPTCGALVVSSIFFFIFWTLKRIYLYFLAGCLIVTKTESKRSLF